MKPTIRYLGHAGFIVEHRETRILIDPWFYPAFLQSWFPYPDNRFLLDQMLAQKFDFLYISHLHHDHYDERLLRQLDKSICVIAPKYRSKGLVRRINALGFQNILQLDHKETRELAPGVCVTMFLDTSHKENSGLMFDLDGFRFVDLNDCNLPMSELPTNVDMLTAQYSGAMWYPQCYNYPPEIMQSKVKAARSSLMDILHRKVSITGCKWYIPSAGPACFLDPTLEKFNDHDLTTFPLWENMYPLFQQDCPNVKALRIHPGDHLTCDGGRVEAHFSRGQASEDLAAYRERRKDEWGEFYDGPEPQIIDEEVDQYFAKLTRRNKHLLRDFKKSIHVSTGGRTWAVQLGKLAESFHLDNEETLDPAYTFILSPRVFKQILEGKQGWEEALLSMRVTLLREPDVFDSRLISLLRYGNEPIKTLQIMRERDSREMIERDGLRIQRFCPHAGEDLTFANICNGIIECPRHCRKWEIKTGRCIEGGRLQLKVECASRNVTA
jgi:UDP-MurNAc hydroxylase